MANDLDGAADFSAFSTVSLCIMSKKIIVALLSLLGLQANAQDSAKAKAECEEVMNALIPFAQQMLEKNGEFLPFGGAMKANGDISPIAGYDGREQPPSGDIIRLIKDGFRSGARSGEYKATALVYDVRVVLPSSGQKSDAVAVSLNHRDSYSVVVYFPYQIKSNKVTFADAFAEKGEADVFNSK